MPFHVERSRGYGSGYMDALSLTDHQRAVLEAFAEAVRASPHNLLSRRGIEELETRHVPESVRFAAQLDVPRGTHVLDLGTGGGFPGFVMAIVRDDLRVTLLDATAKKIDFLAQTAEKLQVEVDTLVGRAEELATTHAGQFGAVTARAVAPLERLVPWAMPFLRPGGTLHAIKGERWAEELRAALPTLKRCRASVVAVPERTTEDLPPGTAPRVVIIRAPG